MELEKFNALVSVVEQRDEARFLLLLDSLIILTGNNIPAQHSGQADRADGQDGASVREQDRFGRFRVEWQDGR